MIINDSKKSLSGSFIMMVIETLDEFIEKIEDDDFDWQHQQILQKALCNIIEEAFGIEDIAP